MNQLGRPTELSEELFAEIRKLVLVNKNMKETLTKYKESEKTCYIKFPIN